MCKGCDGKGYLETFILKNARKVPILEQCLKCKDTAKYSRRVQEMMGIDTGPLTPKTQERGRLLAFPSRRV